MTSEPRRRGRASSDRGKRPAGLAATKSDQHSGQAAKRKARDTDQAANEPEQGWRNELGRGDDGARGEQAVNLATRNRATVIFGAPRRKAPCTVGSGGREPKWWLVHVDRETPRRRGGRGRPGVREPEPRGCPDHPTWKVVTDGEQGAARRPRRPTATSTQRALSGCQPGPRSAPVHRRTGLRRWLTCSVRCAERERDPAPQSRPDRRPRQTPRTRSALIHPRDGGARLAPEPEGPTGSTRLRAKVDLAAGDVPWTPTSRRQTGRRGRGEPKPEPPRVGTAPKPTGRPGRRDR